MEGEDLTRPSFVDNRNGNSLAQAISEHLKVLRDSGNSPEELCIATGYFNAAGWLKVAEEAGRLGKVRLLLGAEPTPAAEMQPRKPGDPREPERTRQQVQENLGRQIRSLKTERDHRFEFHPEGLGHLKRLLDFFRSGHVEVRRYENRFFHAKAWILRGAERGVLAGSSNLTAAGMSRNLELNLGHYDDPLLAQVENWFEEVWSEAAPFDLASLYEALFQEFSPYLIYLRVLWELYGEEVEEEEEDIGLITLARFQKHGVWRARRILDELGGVVVADGVGLGKTFIAGGLMETYRDQRQRILLIRPAALKGTWDKFLSDNYLGDVESISYEGLAQDPQFGGTHTRLDRPVSEYQLVVIDEAHNYRNPDANTRAGVLRQLMRGHRRDLVLLTATPVNNSLYDLYHLVSFFLKQDSRLIKKGIPSIKGLFDQANQIDPGDLHPDLLYPLVDATTVKRTRQFIKKHYREDRIPGPNGKLVQITFPKPVPKTVHYNLDEAFPGFFAHFAEAVMPEAGQPKLAMARYQVDHYLKIPDEENHRETALVGLLRSGLLKRFESSAHAFGNTCRKMASQHQRFLEALDKGMVIRKDFFRECGVSQELDEDEFQELLEQSEHSESAELFEVESLRTNVENDLRLLNDFAEEAGRIKSEEDPKLAALVEELARIAAEAKEHATTDSEETDNRKVLVFSYFKDTALWILNRLKKAIDEDERFVCYKGRIAATCGSPDVEGLLDSDEAAWGFAPRTAAPETYQDGDRFDILIATDVLAEGVNLQQCRHIINYDLPWNPMRLVQRHGRIDRLLSEHRRVYLRTFFPDKDLDALLRLEERVRTKLALAAASVGVAEAPIQDGASRDQSFSESREEIERIESEETDIFEKGGSETAAQTGEEYRQVLRLALQDRLQERLDELPWKAGSGMVKGNQSGYFFCAKVGDQTYLRFVPEDARNTDDLVKELGTCLRLIECAEGDERVFPTSAMDGAFRAWEIAREDVHASWSFFTDPRNLQPKVRRLNREVNDFLLEVQPSGYELKELDRISDILLSPWPMREEKKLREVWNGGHSSKQDKAKSLVGAIKETGIEPFEQPDRYPVIEKREVQLVCWLAIAAEIESSH